MVPGLQQSILQRPHAAVQHVQPLFARETGDESKDRHPDHFTGKQATIYREVGTHLQHIAL